MGIHRLNHAVLYVRDVGRSVAFYQDVLGFRVDMAMGEQAAFLTAPGSTNDHDLGLFALGDQAGDSAAGRTSVGLYHLAWEVDTLQDLAQLADALSAAGGLVGASDHGSTKSLYGKDPDGLEFEIVWLIPAHLLTEADVEAKSSIRPLDLQKEIDRFGSARSGLGISVPVGVQVPDVAPAALG
jgi:catechol-2,3-dioxygenase